MSIIENDSKYNSSSNDDGEIVPSSRSNASNSVGLSPGLINQSTTPSQASVTGAQISPSRQMGDSEVAGMITDNYRESSGQMDFKDSQDQDVMEELGLNLGRRLARLEIGNKINTEKLEKIKERCKIKEKTLAMENARVDDLEGKLISVEARLVSQEKQGFDAKERIETLEKTLKNKDKEMSELKEILSKMDAKGDKDEERFSKLEEGSGQLTKQFLVLLETCETFNEELQALKKMNIELKIELNKKEMAKFSLSGKISSSAPVSDSGGQESLNATKSDGLTNVKSDHLLFCLSNHQKAQTSTTIQTSQIVSTELEKKWRGKAEKCACIKCEKCAFIKWSPKEIKELRKDQVCMHCFSHKCFAQMAKTKIWKCQNKHPKKEVNFVQFHNSAADRSAKVEMKVNRSKSPNQPRGYLTQECKCQPSGYYTQGSNSNFKSQPSGYYIQESNSKSQPSGYYDQESSSKSQFCVYYAQESSSQQSSSSSQPGGYYAQESSSKTSSSSQPGGYYAQESSSKTSSQQSSSSSQPGGYYAQESSSKSHPSSYYAQESSTKSYPMSCYAQEFVPKNPLGYCYSGPSGPDPYYYTTTTQPTFMDYGGGADFSGYQNHEYGRN